AFKLNRVNQNRSYETHNFNVVKRRQNEFKHCKIHKKECHNLESCLLSSGRRIVAVGGTGGKRLADENHHDRCTFPAWWSDGPTGAHYCATFVRISWAKCDRRE